MQVYFNWNGSDLHFSLGLGLSLVCETGGILSIISLLHQITKNLANTNARVFLMKRLWEGWSIWHRSLFWLPLSVSLNFFPFFESHENTNVEFVFCNLSKWECKKYICGTPIHCSWSYPNYEDFRCWETQKCKKGPFANVFGNQIRTFSVGLILQPKTNLPRLFQKLFAGYI